MSKKLVIGALLSLLLSDTAFAKAKWKCGDWKKDPKGKCEEIRTCKRTVCDASGKIENCRTETKTECANPISEKPGKTPSSLMLEQLPSSSGRVKATKSPPTTAPGLARPQPNRIRPGSGAAATQDVPTKPGFIWVDDHWVRERGNKKVRRGTEKTATPAEAPAPADRKFPPRQLSLEPSQRQLPARRRTSQHGSVGEDCWDRCIAKCRADSTQSPTEKQLCPVRCDIHCKFGGITPTFPGQAAGSRPRRTNDLDPTHDGISR